MGNAPNTLGRDYTVTAEVTIPSGGAEGMIVTAGGMSGGYGLMLSPGASWFFNSKPVKYFVWGLLIFGLLLLFVGTAGKWRRRFGYAFVVVAALGLILTFATDMFHMAAGTGVGVQLPGPGAVALGRAFT